MFFTPPLSSIFEGHAKNSSAFEQRPRASYFCSASSYYRSPGGEVAGALERSPHNAAHFAGMVLAALILMKGRIGQLSCGAGSSLCDVVRAHPPASYVVLLRCWLLWWLLLPSCTSASTAYGSHSMRQTNSAKVNCYPSSEPTYSSIGQRIALPGIPAAAARKFMAGGRYRRPGGRGQAALKTNNTTSLSTNPTIGF